ncbi:MAG: hypothetical protein GF364_21260 [Candidatus Lokiarchaeota archaeon]|nr:hypothetical protein [Candidatus Lokiarchaeota archaeon]
MSVEEIIDGLLEEDQNVGGVAVIANDGTLVYQTENWDLTSEVQNVLDSVNAGSSTVLLGVKYMIVERTPERIIGTNIQGKGHLIFAPFDGGVLATYILPQVGPREALFNVQSYAQKLKGQF